MAAAVAIIIPCFNYGQYVREAVQSALDQDATAELIVVDDGSTDSNTLSVLDELQRAGVKIFRQPNKGLPLARNAGIELTSAEFIVCLDADDLLQPTYCSRCLEVMNSRQDVGFVYPTTRVFGDRDKLWSRRAYSGLHLLIDNYIPYAAMFRRKLWADAGGYSGDLKHGYEDWDFWMTAMEHGWRGFHIPEPLFWYRKHGRSMLSASNLERRATKGLLRRRHPRLYSVSQVVRMMVEERFPLPRLMVAVGKEGVARRLTLVLERNKDD